MASENSPKRMYDLAQELMRMAKNSGYDGNSNEMEENAKAKLLQKQNRADYASPKKKKIATARNFLRQDKR